MTTTGWLDFLEAAPREAISPVEVARWQAEQADRRAAADEAEEAARAEDEAEARRFRYRTVGIEPGHVLAVALRGVAEDEEYEAARAVMARIERRRESRRRVAEYQGAQLAAASRASREPEGIEAANRLAARLAAPAARGRRRPFAVRGQADHQCVYCDRENLDPDTSFLLHNDPQLNVPITTAEQATQEDLDYLSQDTGRHARQHGRVITR